MTVGGTMNRKELRDCISFPLIMTLVIVVMAFFVSMGVRFVLVYYDFDLGYGIFWSTVILYFAVLFMYAIISSFEGDYMNK